MRLASWVICVGGSGEMGRDVEGPGGVEERVSLLIGVNDLHCRVVVGCVWGISGEGV